MIAEWKLGGKNEKAEDGDAEVLFRYLCSLKLSLDQPRAPQYCIRPLISCLFCLLWLLPMLLHLPNLPVLIGLLV